MSEVKMSMREKVARAIAQADERNGGPPYEYRVTMSKHAKDHLFDEADAAIDAMRGKEMLDALKQMVVNSEADGNSYRDCHKKAVSAIDKAEGRK